MRVSVKGFYDNKETLCSTIETVMFEKKLVPPPDKYEGRGKEMYDLIKEKN